MNKKGPIIKKRTANIGLTAVKTPDVKMEKMETILRGARRRTSTAGV